ncbi:MAG: N-acetyltransferase [Alphaproteobacteria bacterium]|nr:N-acetyltransferase [Alphaproteobacteria bacterium]
MPLQYTDALPDAAQYFRLFETTGWNEKYGLTKEELSDTLRSSFYCISAYDGNALVGTGRIMSDGVLHAMIYEMIVHPDYQGKGIGREIMHRLLQKCLDNNIRDIQLFCAKGKREFYEKMGFITRPDDGPGMEYRTGSVEALKPLN